MFWIPARSSIQRLSWSSPLCLAHSYSHSSRGVQDYVQIKDYDLSFCKLGVDSTGLCSPCSWFGPAFLANDILILKIQPLYHTTMIDCGPYILMLILKQANGTLAATLKR